MAKCPCQKKPRVRKDSICKKLSERYPVIFWMVLITIILIGILTTIRLTTDISWKTFVYIVVILAFIILFIILAILYLNQFGEEMQVEFKGQIMGQINRSDRPTKTREDWKRERQKKLKQTTFATSTGSTEYDNDSKVDDGPTEVVCQNQSEEAEFNCTLCKAQGLKTRAEAEAAARAASMEQA